MATYLWKWPQRKFSSSFQHVCGFGTERLDVTVCPHLAPQAEPILLRCLSVLAELQYTWPMALTWENALRKAAVRPTGSSRDAMNSTATQERSMDIAVRPYSAFTSPHAERCSSTARNLSRRRQRRFKHGWLTTRPPAPRLRPTVSLCQPVPLRRDYGVPRFPSSDRAPRSSGTVPFYPLREHASPSCRRCDAGAQ